MQEVLFFQLMRNPSEYKQQMDEEDDAEHEMEIIETQTQHSNKTLQKLWILLEQVYTQHTHFTHTPFHFVFAQLLVLMITSYLSHPEILIQKPHPKFRSGGILGNLVF